jgi:hypothetical protein
MNQARLELLVKPQQAVNAGVILQRRAGEILHHG